MEYKRPSGGVPSGGGPASKRSGSGRPSGPNDDEMDYIMEEQFGDEDMEGPSPCEAGGEVDLGEAGRNWVRPPVAEFNPAKSSIVFQQLEVDYYIAAATHGLDTNPQQKQVAIVRMFGVNDAGNSVCVLVHGFEAYFYIEKPRSFGGEDLESLREALNGRLADKTKGCGPAVSRVEVESKASIWNYQTSKRDFIKIVMALPNLVTPCRSLVEGGLALPSGVHLPACTSYESNVLFAMRFMVDTGVVGGSWVELPAGSYVVLPTLQTYCQIEVHVRYDRLIAHPAEGEWSRIAPFRVLSIDIECCGRKGHFPDAKLDPVIQIASMVTLQGSATPVVKNVMTLGTCASIVGAEVMAFETEAELLGRWRDLLVETDPDIIIGYNIINFDLPYLYERAEALGLKDFHQWGRVRGTRTRMRNAQFSSKAYGTHDYKELNIEGRVQFDLMVTIQREHKLASYSLNSVSAHFLGEQKEDVHHSAISELQNGNDESRRRLAVYCLKDAYLPQRLLDKLMFMYNYIEMARVTGVPMSYLLTKGQSIKVFCQLLRKSRQRGLLLPNIKVSAPVGDNVGYEGATVLDPKTGFYDKPVATLDFASLYPSIMMAHNLCYSTLLPPDRLREVAPEERVLSPSGDSFVKAKLAKGVLPEILEELLGARKRAKLDLKAEKDPFKRAVLDGRQLALKISANSVYGFTGATVGKMPCLAISASTTAYGRNMIMHTRQMVQDRYNRQNGYEADCEVIYGDTDSVMVNFKVPSVARAMELGREAADFVSATFIRPVKLEFEKVYFPYLLMNKKRYAGLLWTQPDKHDKMDSKGIETVRRDNCLLVRNVVTTCLEKILIERDVAAAEAYVKNIISDLLMNRIDLSLLVISKGLTKDADTYDTSSAHVELAKKMRKRDPATAPSVGDRVAYVIVKAAKGAKAYEKAEDPVWALDHNLAIDCAHYLEHHLSQPLLRIFQPIMTNPKELLNGDHTRSISVTTPSSVAGGIMKFAKVKLCCLGCKAPLVKAGETTLCSHCAPKELELFQRSVSKVGELEAQYTELWTCCQRCQGSLHQDVLCTSRDCPIFYRRKKVQKDLNEAQATLQRFNEAGDW
ncbi:DNA polymerase delta subunit one [Haematococcus lacustris]